MFEHWVTRLSRGRISHVRNENSIARRNVKKTEKYQFFCLKIVAAKFVYLSCVILNGVDYPLRLLNILQPIYHPSCKILKIINIQNIPSLQFIQLKNQSPHNFNRFRLRFVDIWNRLIAITTLSLFSGVMESSPVKPGKRQMQQAYLSHVGVLKKRRIIDDGKQY